MARILHIITGLGIGGAETTLYRLLSARGASYEHCVVSLGPSGPMGARISALGVPVHSLALNPVLPNPVRLWSIQSLAHKIAPDLTVGWMYHGNLIATWVSGDLHNAPVVWGIRSSLDSYPKSKWRTKAVIRLCARLSHCPDAIIYPGHAARVQHEARGYHGANSVVIPNGVDCREFFPDATARAEVRSELGLDDSHILVGLVARFHPVKDQPGFLRASALVARNHSRARFLLVGAGIDTNSSLRGLIQELGLQDRAFLLGERTDIPRIDAALDIACCASLGEAFPNAIAEAMACAVPCVVTNVGDNASLVAETGISLPAGDPDSLADALNRIVSAPAANRRQYGAAARRRIEQKFSLPAMVARYEELFARHISSAATTPSNDVSLDPALRA